MRTASHPANAGSRKRRPCLGLNADKAKVASLLAAYPNPSTGPVYLVYEVPEGVEQVELHVHDATGRLIHAERVPSRNGILELTKASFSPGMHIASLRFDGILAGTAKLEVVR